MDKEDMWSMDNQICQGEAEIGRLTSEITQLKSELEKCRVEMESVRAINEQLKRAVKAQMEEPGIFQNQLHTSEQRVNELVGACAEAQKHIDRAWKSTEHVEFSDAMKDATSTLHKAIGEVK
jgi:chromosome segregation ATPase